MQSDKKRAELLHLIMVHCYKKSFLTIIIQRWDEFFPSLQILISGAF